MNFQATIRGYLVDVEAGLFTGSLADGMWPEELNAYWAHTGEEVKLWGPVMRTCAAR